MYSNDKKKQSHSLTFTRNMFKLWSSTSFSNMQSHISNRNAEITCYFHTRLGLKHITRVSILSIPQNIKLLNIKPYYQAYCKATAQARILSCKPGEIAGGVAAIFLISFSSSSFCLSWCFLFASSCSNSSSSCISNNKSCSFISPQALCVKVYQVS